MRKKRYLINMNTGKLTFIIHCKSLKTAKWLMNLRFWKYSKIHDMEDDHKCIEFIKR